MKHNDEDDPNKYQTRVGHPELPDSGRFSRIEIGGRDYTDNVQEIRVTEICDGIPVITQRWTAPTRRHHSHWWVDAVALWFAVFSVWPFADPGHSGDTTLSNVDLALHVLACLVIGWRWKLVRR